MTSRSYLSRLLGAFALISATLLFSSQLALAQFTQQGPKLVGTGAVGGALQGYSVALSGDGNTAISGGPADNGETGAAWVYTRSGGVWTQQGSKLVGTGAVNSPSPAIQGQSVALSADGNTALVGGPNDNGGIGAAWVYTRSNGVWTQQGSKLVGTGAVNSPSPAIQGQSVALSADGNTALVGGPNDNGGIGAAWVYTRSGGVWTQQGNKLVGGALNANQGRSVSLSADGNTALVGGPSYGEINDTGAAWVFNRSYDVWAQQGPPLVGTGPVGAAMQGISVSLSADGNTALVGGPSDNSDTGAAWGYNRSGGVWIQQGSKLVGTSAVGAATQGISGSLSDDGNTAIVGGPEDNSGIGAAWVYTHHGDVWPQQGTKLVGTGAVGGAQQGISVALSADGSTAIVGGYFDNGDAGAAWVFVQPPSLADKTNTHDFNGDGYSDIAWRDGSGDIAFWLMKETGVLSYGGVGGVPAVWSIVGQRDFNGDGKADLLWRDTSGDTAMWFMNGMAIASTASVGNIPTNWAVVGTGDFNGDGMGDILWEDNNGNLAVWLMNGATITSVAGLGSLSTNWMVVGTGDFNGDGKADILWRDNLGNIAIWFMNGTAVSSTASVGNIPTSWSVAGTGDFNGDGKSDIVWRDNVGDAAIWLMNGAAVSSAAGLGNVATTWSIALVGDYDGDGMSDLLWRDTSGNNAIWFMNGLTVSSSADAGNMPTTWTVQSVNAE